MSLLVESAGNDLAAKARRAPRKDRQLALVITVDTEEEFDWMIPPQGQTPQMSHMRELPRLQDSFDEAGARATYVVDYPVLRDEASVEVLRGFASRGTCEMGAHLHPWVNPPIVEDPLAKNTYLCNLPRALQEEKIAALVEAYFDAFDRRPRVFKAGRYGIDFGMADVLQRQGFAVDASAVAYTDLSYDGGPDFSQVSSAPFELVGGEDAPLLEVPCSVAYTRRPFWRWHAFHQWLSRAPQRHLRLVGILWKLRLLRKYFLSPEQHTWNELKIGMRALADDGAPLIQLTLHSPSIAIGHTPYVRTESERKRLLNTLSSATAFAREELGASCQTLSEFALSYSETLP